MPGHLFWEALAAAALSPLHTHAAHDLEGTAEEVVGPRGCTRGESGGGHGQGNRMTDRQSREQPAARNPLRTTMNGSV